MHTIKIYMIDPELVLEKKIVVNPDNSHYSYMGKPSKKFLIAYIKEGESFSHPL